MKFILPILMLISFSASANTVADTVIFPFGENPGYYGSQFTDQNIYDLMYAAGARAARPVLTLQQYIQYGAAAFAASFNYPYQTKGMRNNVLCLTIQPYYEGGTNYTGQSTFVTNNGSGTRSLLPASLNLPVFNSDSSINTNNLWAKFVADVFNVCGNSFSVIEAYNEPDFSFNYVVQQYDSSFGVYNSWATLTPNPDDLANIYDSLKNFVRLQQITYQVVHYLSAHNSLNVKVAFGGVSSQYWFRQYLKISGATNIWADKISLHIYPYYGWTFYTNQSPLGVGNQRFSDMELRVQDSTWQTFVKISGQQGVSSSIGYMLTETGTPRWTYDMQTAAGSQNKVVGNDHVQRNYQLKGMANLWRRGFTPVVWFQTGESADSAVTTGSQFNAFGMYKNLTTASVGNTTFTQSGIAFRTFQNLCGNYTLYGTQPSFTYVGNTPNGIVLDSSGYKIYMLWANTYLDLDETASGTYSLPAGTYNIYDYTNTLIGTSNGGTVNLIGDPYFFKQVSGTGVLLPVANAGSNQQLNLGTTTATLNGSASTNYTTSTWSFVSSTNSVTPSITSASSITTGITGLSATVGGTYNFLLTVMDASSNTSTARVSITVSAVPCNCALPKSAGKIPSGQISVNKAGASVHKFIFPLDTIPTCKNPIINTSPNLLITLPVNSTTISANITTQNGSGLKSVNWIQTAGVTGAISSPNALSTVVSGFKTSGTATYQITVADSCGMSNNASVVVTIAPAPPIVINSVTVTPNTIKGSATAKIAGVINSKLTGSGTIVISNKYGNKLSSTAFKKTSVNNYNFSIPALNAGHPLGTDIGYIVTVSLAGQSFKTTFNINWAL